jgi:hypothetical protein
MSLQAMQQLGKMQMTCDHCKKWGQTSRCGRCRIAHYCSATCQKAAWLAHKGFCHKPSEASALEQQAMRDRAKSGQAFATSIGPSGNVDYAQILQREFVLASGERTVATSNRKPDFSVFSLPHYFEWSWPMHELLPNELAPLNAPFYVKTNMNVHRQWESLCPAPVDYAGSSISKQEQFIVQMMSQSTIATTEGAVMKFVEHIPRLRDAVKLGQPEATARWKKGCQDMNMLLYWRWQRNSLTRPPFALVPLALRFYELDSFRPAAESEEENASARDQAERESRANETDVKLQRDYFVLRMPTSPFPRTPEPAPALAHDTDTESK